MSKMWTARMAFLVLALALALNASPALADSISGSATGLSSPGTTLTFSELSFPINTVITNQFAGFGVTFSPGLTYDPQAGFFPTAALGNFNLSESGVTNPFSILFSQPVSAAAFQMLTNAGTSTFSAFLNGSLVESFNASTGTSLTNAFYGFSNITFDEIRVTAGGFNESMLMDNLEYDFEPVPEPATLLLLGGGLIGAAFLFRRRKLAEPK